MRLVAIDTTSTVASVALFDGGTLVARAESDAFQGQAEALLPLIQKTLESERWDKRAVEAWCACAGPGSFTGIRIALATVRGICLATGAKGASVSSFQAIRAGLPDNELVAVVMPGLPGEYFCEVTEGSSVIVPPVLLTEQMLATTLSAQPDAKRIDATRVTAESVGKAYLRFGGDPSLSPLYIAPPRITLPKPKTHGSPQTK